MNQQNLPEDVFKALGEKPLLMTGFKPTALIYTYTHPKHVQVIEIEKYELVCSDVDKEVVLRLKKIDVMFAIKADTLETVQNSIHIDTDVKKRNLRTAYKRDDRPIVLTNEKLQNGLKREVRLVMRSGHILIGQLIRYSAFNLVLNIRGAMVLIYRHGVLEYSIRPDSHISTS